MKPNTLKLLTTHLTDTIPKGGHGFEQRTFYQHGGTLESLVERIHYQDHLRNQRTLQHQKHSLEIELEREKLINQYWTGRTWKRQPELSQQWKTLKQADTIGDPDLVASLLEIVRVFGEPNITFRVESGN
jgi:hypothetical protein